MVAISLLMPLSAPSKHRSALVQVERYSVRHPHKC